MFPTNDFRSSKLYNNIISKDRRL